MEASNPTPVLDFSVVKVLRDELGAGDPTFFNDLIQSFAKQAETLVATMRQAVAEGDLNTLQRAAHSLKGSSLNLGAPALANLCASLEQYARNQTTREVGPLLEQIDTQRKVAVRALLDADGQGASSNASQ